MPFHLSLIIPPEYFLSARAVFDLLDLPLLQLSRASMMGYFIFSYCLESGTLPGAKALEQV